jgi:hypothetical protein
MIKLLYKPLSLLISVLSGILAARVGAETTTSVR